VYTTTSLLVISYHPSSPLFSFILPTIPSDIEKETVPVFRAFG
jgi:hypothetical protein